jgi:hypothetical protein
MTEREFLERLDGHIAEMRRHNERADEQMQEIREEARTERRRNQARFENTRAVMREMVLELREGREMLADMRHGIQANTEGLLRVLGELRRSDGPDAVGA